MTLWSFNSWGHGVSLWCLGMVLWLHCTVDVFFRSAMFLLDVAHCVQNDCCRLVQIGDRSLSDLLRGQISGMIVLRVQFDDFNGTAHFKKQPQKKWGPLVTSDHHNENVNQQKRHEISTTRFPRWFFTRLRWVLVEWGFWCPPWCPSTKPH